MNGAAIPGTAGRGWLRGAAWAVGAGVVSWMLGTLCIMAGAFAALLLEVNTTRTVSMAINWAAFLFMIASYSVLLVTIMGWLARRYDVPWAVWLGLVAYPLVWGVLMLSSPSGVYSSTPLWVNGVGLAVAWLAVGRRRLLPQTREV